MLVAMTPQSKGLERALGSVVLSLVSSTLWRTRFVAPSCRGVVLSPCPTPPLAPRYAALLQKDVEALNGGADGDLL